LEWGGSWFFHGDCEKDEDVLVVGPKSPAGSGSGPLDVGYIREECPFLGHVVPREEKIKVGGGVNFRIQRHVRRVDLFSCP